MCNEPFVAKRCKERVWHWAHKPYTNQKENTCLFDDSEWALRWRLAYHMFDGWKIEVPKTLPSGRRILLHAMNPDTMNVREFIGHINEKNEERFAFLLGATNHKVCWMFDDSWLKDSFCITATGGFKDCLKPKAQALYNRICAAGQGTVIHGNDNLYKEWVKVTKDLSTGKITDSHHTGVWFQIQGEKARAVLDNYNKVELPYDDSKSVAESKKVNFNKFLEAV